MKYSNHGFGLLGLVIEAVTGERYGDWISRKILSPLKLTETRPDGPFVDGVPVARGHSAELPLGRRVIIPGDNPTNALAPATGFVSTAADLVRFFTSLDPDSKHSVISPASRRAMLHRQWHDPHAAVESYYGLGLCLGSAGGWEWAGHGGGFQSAKTFTAMFPGRELCFSVLTNASDGMAETCRGGLIQILRTFATNSGAKARTRSWKGRWWSLGDVIDLVPFDDRVLIAAPDQLNPFGAVDEICVKTRDRGVISLSGGYGIHGETARLVRSRDGKVREVWLGGDRWVSERRMAANMSRKYDR
jgi:CubicO group peptidase (beta-lactamase class C family)